jgi:hypothetical protein
MKTATEITQALRARDFASGTSGTTGPEERGEISGPEPWACEQVRRRSHKDWSLALTLAALPLGAMGFPPSSSHPPRPHPLSFARAGHVAASRGMPRRSRTRHQRGLRRMSGRCRGACASGHAAGPPRGSLPDVWRIVYGRALPEHCNLCTPSSLRARYCARRASAHSSHFSRPLAGGTAPHSVHRPASRRRTYQLLPLFAFEPRSRLARSRLARSRLARSRSSCFAMYFWAHSPHRLPRPAARGRFMHASHSPLPAA